MPDGVHAAIRTHPSSAVEYDPPSSDRTLLRPPKTLRHINALLRQQHEHHVWNTPGHGRRPMWMHVIGSREKPLGCPKNRQRSSTNWPNPGRAGPN